MEIPSIRTTHERLIGVLMYDSRTADAIVIAFPRHWCEADFVDAEWEDFDAMCRATNCLIKAEESRILSVNQRNPKDAGGN